MSTSLRLAFTTSEAPAGLVIVNDVVMGGVSSATVAATGDGLIFEGVVSAENGGGFASFRFPVAIPGACRTAIVEARGDGRRYKLVLRGREAGVQYQAGFPAPPEWRRSVFPLDAFAARHRGRQVAAPPLRFEEMAWAGLLVAERQYGPFRIAIRALSFEA